MWLTRHILILIFNVCTESGMLFAIEFSPLVLFGKHEMVDDVLLLEFFTKSRFKKVLPWNERNRNKKFFEVYMKLVFVQETCLVNKSVFSSLIEIQRTQWSSTSILKLLSRTEAAERMNILYTTMSMHEKIIGLCIRTQPST